ncbi:hypothetical protein ABN226_18715, partial [Morganella morganii]
QILSATQQSFSDGMNAAELIAWWDWGVIRGENLGEVVQNYLMLKLHRKYAFKIQGLDTVKARKEINDMIQLQQYEIWEKEKKKKTGESSKQEDLSFCL